MTARVLVAAQPAACGVLQRMLRETAETLPAHRRSDAFRILRENAGGINLVICTIAFDDSQMIDFLQTVKRDPDLGKIPVLCTRVFASVLSDTLVSVIREACKEAGAVDLIDLATLDPKLAKAAINTAVMQCLRRSQALPDG